MAQQATAALKPEERALPVAQQNPQDALGPIDAWTRPRGPRLSSGSRRAMMDPSLRLAEVLDRSLHYATSRLTQGRSPMALAEMHYDWLIHLSLSPGKQLQLWHKGHPDMQIGTIASHPRRCRS
jgi:poly(hydroxyalkanoate) polymerase-like protein